MNIKILPVSVMELISRVCSLMLLLLMMNVSNVNSMDDIPAEEDAGGGDVGAPAAGAAAGPVFPLKKSVWDQTVLAAQQLGIIVGVALLVGGGFMLMVGIELSMIWVVEKCSQLMGTQTVKDPEDPAALVGSFKRYK